LFAFLNTKLTISVLSEILPKQFSGQRGSLFSNSGFIVLLHHVTHAYANTAIFLVVPIGAPPAQPDAPRVNPNGGLFLHHILSHTMHSALFTSNTPPIFF
jgi:hypothetical protein